MEDEEEKHIEMEEQDVEKASSAPSDDSFINDDSDDPIIDDDDDNQQSLTEVKHYRPISCFHSFLLIFGCTSDIYFLIWLQEPLTDKEIEELIAELLETESKVGILLRLCFG